VPPKLHHLGDSLRMGERGGRKDKMIRENKINTKRMFFLI
jgi:hypothetical protein